METTQDRTQAAELVELETLGLSKITLDGTMDEIHLSHFTSGVLERLLEGSGFRVLENNLDPHYVAEGLKESIWGLYYHVGSVVRSVLGINLYETIWVVARKTS